MGLLVFAIGHVHVLVHDVILGQVGRRGVAGGRGVVSEFESRIVGYKHFSLHTYVFSVLLWKDMKSCQVMGICVLWRKCFRFRFLGIRQDFYELGQSFA